MRLTKIVATISDQRCDIEFIKSLYDAGMNVARINTAHINKESGKKVVDNIRSVSSDIAILIDTKGPEIRTINLESDLEVKEGETINISGNNFSSELPQLYVSYPDFAKNVPIGSKILIDDGDIELEVSENKGDHLSCLVLNNGTIKNKKSINVPGVTINLPSLSEKDKDFILFAVENDLDFIAHSFVRNKEDVLSVKDILNQHSSTIEIISKIEDLDGVNNIDEILEISDGIMVARGDLGIEIPAEKIPGIQRLLIRKAVQQKKPVIIATQMLHSMIEHPRPTRAEVSDVANAIYSRTDAIMLSGETANGKYPVEAVKTMDKIARESEKGKDKRNDFTIPAIHQEIPTYLAQSAIRAARELKPKAIVTTTTTGRTARYLAAYRSDVPVYTKCHASYVVRQMALSYGIFPSFLPMKKNKFRIEKAAIKSLIEDKKIEKDDLIIYVGGRFGEDCGATFLEISKAGQLSKGHRPKKESDFKDI